MSEINSKTRKVASSPCLRKYAVRGSITRGSSESRHPTHSLYYTIHTRTQTRMAEARAARLAATEARLAGSSRTGTNPDEETKKEIKKEEPIFEPTEKGDSEKKKEFTKLLFRGVVRDNGYKEAMGCVDVSRIIIAAELGIMVHLRIYAGHRSEEAVLSIPP